MEALGGRGWSARKLRKALRRLRVDPRGGPTTAARAPTIAGGARKPATGAVPHCRASRWSARRMTPRASPPPPDVPRRSPPRALAPAATRRPRRSTATTEGAYVDVGDLKYQVQISRQLNPADVEDRDYLMGLAGATGSSAADEEWFAVFMRV